MNAADKLNMTTGRLVVYFKEGELDYKSVLQSGLCCRAVIICFQQKKIRL
jgi:hypothetical protein